VIPEHTRRERELWVAKALAKPEWHLAEALVWVAYRDGSTLGEVLKYGESPLLADSADLIRATIELTVRDDPAAVEVAPWAALELALITGDAQVVADFPDGSNHSPRPIEADDWQHTEFKELPPYGKIALVDTRRWRGRHSGSRDGIMVAPRFVRRSVMISFPPRDTPPIQRSDAQAVRPNHPMDGMSLSRWVVHPETARVVETRCSERPLSEKRIRAELKQMLTEQGKTCAPGSLEAKRRLGGFVTRTQ
jgi:hypothetical protein